MGVVEVVLVIAVLVVGVTVFVARGSKRLRDEFVAATAPGADPGRTSPQGESAPE